MKYFKNGMNRKYYSIAFKRYRNEILAKNLGKIMTVVIILIAALVIFKKIRRKKKNVPREEGLL